MAFTPRLNSVGMMNNFHWYSRNPFYMTDPDLGLPNCTCYAWGRFWEIGDPADLGVNRPTLPTGNAGTWWNTVGSEYEKGQTPKLGAVLCFDTIPGHVAIVEEILPGNVIVTSNSNYGGDYFVLYTFYPDSNGKYHLTGSGGVQMTSQGFIYNPFADQPTPPTPGQERKKFPWVLYAKKFRSGAR